MWFLLEQGKETEGLLALHRGLSLGRRYRFVHLEFYQPTVMRSLFARALDEKIEPEYVKGLIRKLTLTPLDAGNLRPWAASYTEGRPFPIKIHTLGRFDILLHEEPLQFSGKEQKKPLEMLKTLIALGCVDVPAERLTDALWPNADGDLAHKSFETTLSRLRGLLGTPSCLLYRSGTSSLNPLCCWVDSSALERLLAVLRSAPREEQAALHEKILCLYQGEFLGTDAALSRATIPREKYKRGVLNIILAEGNGLRAQQGMGKRRRLLHQRDRHRQSGRGVLSPPDDLPARVRQLQRRGADVSRMPKPAPQRTRHRAFSDTHRYLQFPQGKHVTTGPYLPLIFAHKTI